MSDDGRLPVDDLIAAGLYDPAAPGAGDRLALLDHLLGEGCTVDELVVAEAAGRLVSAAADAHLRRHQAPVDAVTVAGLAGVDPTSIAPAWRSIGFPDPPPDAELWWPSDAATFAAFEQAAAIFGAERLAQFSRVLGRAAAQVAEAAVAMFLTDVQTRLEHDRRPPVELARANVTAQQAADTIAVVFESAFRHHVQATQRRIDATTFTEGRDRPVLCVGFADLVGSTELVHRLDPAGTARLAADLEQVATDVVARHEGRLVKTIGDGLLFTTPGTAPALGIAADLAGWAEEDERLRGLRVGMATGPVVWQDGDVHGPVVNLAARLCAAADGWPGARRRLLRHDPHRHVRRQRPGRHRLDSAGARRRRRSAGLRRAGRHLHDRPAGTRLTRRRAVEMFFRVQANGSSLSRGGVCSTRSETGVYELTLSAVRSSTAPCR